MDPDEALRLYHHARAAGDDEEAAEHADNLLTWLRGGGFRPKGFARSDEQALRAYARKHGARGLGAYGAGAIDDPFMLSPEVAPSLSPVGGAYAPEVSAPWEADPFFAVAPSSDPWMPSPVTYTPGEVLAAAPTGTPAPSGTLGDLWASTADKLAAAAKTPAAADVDVWLHDDSRGFDVAIPQSMIRAREGATDKAFWTPGGGDAAATAAGRAACVADLRALMIGSMYAVNLASKTPAVEVSPAVIGSIYPGSAPYVAPAGGTPPSLAFTPRKLADFEDPTVGAAAVALQLK